jgi:hypothetical protein
MRRKLRRSMPSQYRVFGPRRVSMVGKSFTRREGWTAAQEAAEVGSMQV